MLGGSVRDAGIKGCVRHSRTWNRYLARRTWSDAQAPSYFAATRAPGASECVYNRDRLSPRLDPLCSLGNEPPCWLSVCVSVCVYMGGWGHHGNKVSFINKYICICIYYICTLTSLSPTPPLQSIPKSVSDLLFTFWRRLLFEKSSHDSGTNGTSAH